MISYSLMWFCAKNNLVPIVTRCVISTLLDLTRNINTFCWTKKIKREVFCFGIYVTAVLRRFELAVFDLVLHRLPRSSAVACCPPALLISAHMTSDPRGRAERSDLGQTALGCYSVKWFWIRILSQIESGRRCLASSEMDNLGLSVAFNGKRAWAQSKRHKACWCTSNTVKDVNRNFLVLTVSRKDKLWLEKQDCCFESTALY